MKCNEPQYKHLRFKKNCFMVLYTYVVANSVTIFSQFHHQKVEWSFQTTIIMLCVANQAVRQDRDGI